MANGFAFPCSRHTTLDFSDHRLRYLDRNFSEYCSKLAVTLDWMPPTLIDRERNPEHRKWTKIYVRYYCNGDNSQLY